MKTFSRIPFVKTRSVAITSHKHASAMYAGSFNDWRATKINLAEMPEAVLRATTKCPHNCGCLTSGKCGDQNMCTVNYSFGNNVLMLAPDEQQPCPYRVSFGSAEICTCPVHQFLYNSQHGLNG